MRLKILISILFFAVLLPRKLPTEIKQPNFEYPSSTLNKIGDSPPPGNPMNDRAKGYILDGKINNDYESAKSLMIKKGLEIGLKKQ